LEQSLFELQGVPSGHLPSAVPPSSQTSSKSTMPLPQVCSDLQSFEHLSGVHLPVVQSELALHGEPSEQLPFVVLPSSHFSPGSTKPLPQASFDMQSWEQPSPSMMLPSS